MLGTKLHQIAGENSSIFKITTVERRQRRERQLDKFLCFSTFLSLKHLMASDRKLMTAVILSQLSVTDSLFLSDKTHDLSYVSVGEMMSHVQQGNMSVFQLASRSKISRI